MRNSDYAEHLSGKNAELATKLNVPIGEMSDKHLRGAGFTDDAVRTIRAVGENKPWLPLTRVNGVGPKTAQELYDEYDIETVDQLKDAIHSSFPLDIDNLSHIKRAIEWVDEGRIELERAKDIATRFYNEMQEHFDKLKAVGSLRREQDTVGDIDMLGVPTSETSEVQEAFKGVCDYTIRCGEKKMTGRYEDEQVDIQLVSEEEWPAALQYFTGSQDHNIRLRRCAKEDGLKLNEYGLWKRQTNERVPVDSERDLYEKLLGEYIPPEMREGNITRIYHPGGET